MGAAAEPALLKLWTSEDNRKRARALWLLARIKGKEDSYIRQALTDKDADIRITGLRAARQIMPDVIPYVQLLVQDSDPQVLREAAIALHHNTSPQAPTLWAQLAGKYDGKDRWYLEALGIGADNQWDAFLKAWQQSNVNVNKPEGRDIVWRSRSAVALPILSTFITDEATASADRLKYFRAFDFISAPQKEDILLAMLDNKGTKRDEIVLTALNTLQPQSLASSAKAKAVLTETLDKIKGSQPFVELVKRYKVNSKSKELLDMALAMPDSSLGRDAAGILIETGGAGLLKNAIKSSDTTTSIAALKTLGRAGTKESGLMMQGIITDASFSQTTREKAIKMMAAGWNESEKLLNMLRENKLSGPLKAAAATALTTSYRKDIRSGALAFAPVTNVGGKPLAPINELAKMEGDVAMGNAIFMKSCSSCHQVANQGVSFGPALTKIGNKLTKDALYVSIIHPDAGVSFGYEGHIFKMKDGNVVAGIISSETADAVEVNTPGGTKQKLVKSQIQSRKEMENSMMPATLYQTMSQQELVNLVEYLFSLKEKTVAVR